MNMRISVRGFRSRWLVAILALVCAAIVVPGKSSPPNANERAADAPKKVEPEPKAPAEVAMPFHVGEKLDYRVAWTSFDDAAAVELSIPERRNLFGWQTWHFQAVIHTLRSVHTLFPVDDQFDSYTDASSLESRQFEMYRNELGKSTAKVYDLVHPGQQARAPGPAVIVSPGTRDPLGMLFTLRAVDWQSTPEVRVPVYDGHDLYEMRAQIEAASDAVEVDAGNFQASRISIRLFKNGNEDASVHFTIWLANNPARTPVQFAAELPFGDLRVELIGAEAGATPDAAQSSGTTQSSGGKSICQNVGEGLTNSMPSCILPPCAFPTCTTRQSSDCCVALFETPITWFGSTLVARAMSAP